MKIKRIVGVVLAILLLTACGGESASSDAVADSVTADGEVPAAYAGLTSPIPPDAESLARGQAHFNQFCATCHGMRGQGDGPAAATLDPTPPKLAEVSLVLADDYLFWRISEGGGFEPFNSAMTSWKNILDEQARWDVINYARTLSAP